MWMQIRLIEKKFLRSLTTTKPSSVETTIASMNTVVTTSRGELE